LETPLRKTWKEVGLGFLNLLVIVAVIVAVQPLLRRYAGGMGAGVLALICLAAYVAGSKWIERRNPVELEPNRALPEGTAGLLFGFGLFALVIAILRVAGVYHSAGWGTYHGVGQGFALAVFAGIVEEVLFRGLLFRLCSKLLGTWGALLLTSALFGAAHAANPGATISSSAAIALEAGILLGTSYAATQRLWLPIGMHVGWNFTEGSVFGMTLSGLNLSGSVTRGTLSGSRLLTGGAFGPEASIVAVVVCLGAGLYFTQRTIKLNRVEPPIWSKPRPDAAPPAVPAVP
jgi:uncharacterized protein